jgi:hypothetical protein
MSLLQLDEFKTRQRATWQGGDYKACSPYIAEVGELVVTRADITPRPLTGRLLLRQEYLLSIVRL